MGLLTAKIHTQRQAERTPLTSLGADLTSLGADGASAKRRANRGRAGNARPRPRGRDLGLLPSPELHDQGWSATQRPVAVAPPGRSQPSMLRGMHGRFVRKGSLAFCPLHQ